MGLDIRLPIGLMFAILGVVLIIAGLVLDSSIYRRSLGINVNLWWGLVLAAFGAAMLILGRRGGSRMRPTEESPEGRAIESIEHAEGLENESEKEK
jgi:hypothetical protein